MQTKHFEHAPGGFSAHIKPPWPVAPNEGWYCSGLMKSPEFRQMMIETPCGTICPPL